MSTDHFNVSRDETELPNFQQRFERLKPSRELLQFYRDKFTEYDSEYQELCKKIETYESIQIEMQKARLENQQREDEIKQLQQALSDMQVYLFQEREHVLRLYAENDRLKIKDLESRKKIQHLLTVQGITRKGGGGGGGGESTYIFKEPPAKVLVSQHTPSDTKGRGPGGHKTLESTSPPAASAASGGEGDTDKESLLLTIESLNAQLEEHAKLCKEQVDALLEDRQIKMEESDGRNERDSIKIQTLSDQYHKSQCLLYESTKDFLQVKYELRAKEREWIAEKDKLLQEMDKLREQISVASGKDSLLDFSCLENFSPQDGRKGPDTAQLQLQLQQTQQLADWYREQSIKCEDELGRVKEENEAAKSLFKERTAKLNQRLELMNKRYQALEKRRSLEVEGYKNDIKILRQKLKDLEKKLYRVTTTIASSSANGTDIDVLAQVKETALNSNRIMGDLRQLKGKIYTIEKDFRNMHSC